MNLIEKLNGCIHVSMPQAVKDTLNQTIKLLGDIHSTVDGRDFDPHGVTSELIRLLDAADMSVANPSDGEPLPTVKVLVTEFVKVEFFIEVPAGLSGEELGAAVEEARVQAGPETERTEDVTNTEWELA